MTKISYQSDKLFYTSSAGYRRVQARYLRVMISEWVSRASQPKEHVSNWSLCIWEQTLLLSSNTCSFELLDVRKHEESVNFSGSRNSLLHTSALSISWSWSVTKALVVLTLIEMFPVCCRNCHKCKNFRMSKCMSSTLAARLLFLGKSRKDSFTLSLVLLWVQSPALRIISRALRVARRELV